MSFVSVDFMIVMTIAEDSRLFMAFFNQNMLLELFWKVNLGRAAICEDTTFNLCKKAVNMLAMRLTGLTEVYHPTDSFIIPEDGESFIFYLNALEATEVPRALSMRRILRV